LLIVLDLNYGNIMLKKFLSVIILLAAVGAWCYAATLDGVPWWTPLAALAAAFIIVWAISTLTGEDE